MNVIFRLKSASLTISLILVAQILVAQQKQDAVYLLNGGIVRGNIIEYLPDSHIKIQTIEGKIWQFQAQQIKEVTQENMQEIISEHKVELPKENSTFKNKGYTFTSSVGVMPRTKVSAWSFAFVNSYQFVHRISAGIGVGVESFENLAYESWGESYKHTLLPVWADICYFPLSTETTPFLYAKTGYAFSLGTNDYLVYSQENENKGGITFGTGIGVRKILRGNAAIIFSIGYRYQMLTENTSYNYWSTPQEIKNTSEYNRIELRLGVSFN